MICPSIRSAPVPDEAHAYSGTRATSARTALLADAGERGDGESWRNDSIVGTSFDARVIGREPRDVLTEVEGTAFRTGEHRSCWTRGTSRGTGFVLR
jgi:proline racemase